MTNFTGPRAPTCSSPKATSALVPHSIGAQDGPVEILTLFDQDGERAHLYAPDATPSDRNRMRRTP